MRSRLGLFATPRVWVTSSFVVVLLVVVSGAMGAPADSPYVRVGTPWTGAAGSERTTAEIMAEERALGPRLALSFPLFRPDLEKQPSPDSPPTTGDTRLGAALAKEAPLTVGTNFTGTTLSEAGFVPPDSMGAVGPSQFLVATNGRIKVFSKTGVVGSLNSDLSTFFFSVISPSATAFDPEVRYDSLSGRWYVLAVDSATTNNRILLAVSDTGTISGGTVWSFFDFAENTPSPAGDTNDAADFPTLGIDANALYVGTNIFDPSHSNNFVNCTLFVIKKSSVTGGGPIVVTAFRDVDSGSNPSFTAGPYSPQGVDNADPAATSGYFVGIDIAFFGKLDVLRVSTPGGTPTLSGNLAVSVPATAVPLNPTVVGSTKPLDGIDDRLGPASIVNGKLYTAHNIGVDASGTATNSPTRNAVRWYELSNLGTTPTLSRSGTIYDSTANATSYWIPSMAMSPEGNAVIGMSIGSASTHPDGAVASMLSGDASFSAPTAYTASSASYNPSFDTGNPYRWGDFSHTSVDPCDGQTFWTVQEYVDATDDWAVRVGKIAAPPPATPASTSPSSVPAGQASTSVTLTGTSSSGSAFWDPGSGSCRIGVAIDGSVTVNSVTFTDATHLTLNISTVGATVGQRTVTVTNPDGQTAAAAVFVVGTPPSNTVLPTASGTDAVGSMLTGTDGTWTGSPAPTLTRQWRRCDTGGANCVDIGGATASTYTLVNADAGSTIRFRVTGTNVAGSSSADSTQTSTVTGPPVNTVLPTISGSNIDGSTLTAADGTWTGFPAPAFTVQWERCNSSGASCANIASATNQTYTTVVGDLSGTIRVKVTGTNGSGSPSAESAATNVISTLPANTVLPTISGTASVGSTLVDPDGTWTGTPTPVLTRQWRSCDTGGANCVDISGATATTYTLVNGDAGSTIRLRVTGTNPGGAVSADSVATAVVTGGSSGGGGGGGGGGSSSFSLSVSPPSQVITSGGTATFTITITNTGGAYLYSVQVSDPAAPGCSPPSQYADPLSFMAPMLAISYQCSLSNVTQSFTNNVNASAVTGPGPVLTQSATAVVTVQAPVTAPTPAPVPSTRVVSGGNSGAATLTVTGLKPVLLETPKPKLSLTVTVSKGTTLVLTLLDSKGHRVARWILHETAGHHKLLLLLPPAARHGGHDSLHITETGNSKPKIFTVILRA